MKKNNLLVLTLSTLLLASCGGEQQEIKTENIEGVDVPEIITACDGMAETGDELDEYFDESGKIYNEVLGQFYKAYKASEEAKSDAERYALQAISEAKLLEAGIMVPGSSNGGTYAVSRVVPYSISPVFWGQDNYRYHNALVVSEHAIKAEDRVALKALYTENKGSGKYEAKAKAFLSEKGYHLKRDYTISYSGDPETFDVHNSYYSTDSEPLVNTYDGLVEYDGENEIQPALAKSWNVSKDGKTYTFTLREGVKWVTRDGTDTGFTVTGDDFVAGMQHMLDCQGGLEFLVDGVIKNATQYINGDITDFSQVGVHADGQKVIFELEKPVSYFMTMLGYSIFAPLSRSYYQSMGGKFGDEYDPTAATYKYAKDYSSIAYCGPYLVKQFTPESTFVFEKNESYWNKDNINIDKITWLFNDGSDATKAYNQWKNGEVDSAGLNPTVLPTSKTDKLPGDEKSVYDTYSYVSGTDANSYPFYLNVARAAYANSNDPTACISPKSAAEKTLAEKAMANVYIRLGICFASSKQAYYTPAVGEELALKSAVNSYTPGTFVSLPEAVTVSINGKNVRFKKGTYYGEIMQAQIDADKLPIKVWDPTADDGVGSSAGFDGWYNKKNAFAFLTKGIQQLAEQGVTVDTSHPIVLDLPAQGELRVAECQALKQSIEGALGGLVKVNVVVLSTAKAYYYSGYYCEEGRESNYDIYTLAGWGPDYGDPSTYLGSFAPTTGGMAKNIGIY